MKNVLSFSMNFLPSVVVETVITSADSLSLVSSLLDADVLSVDLLSSEKVVNKTAALQEVTHR